MTAGFTADDLLTMVAEMDEAERLDYRSDLYQVAMTARRGSREREWAGLVLAILGIEERAPGAIEIFNEEQ